MSTPLRDRAALCAAELVLLAERGQLIGTPLDEIIRRHALDDTEVPALREETGRILETMGYETGSGAPDEPDEPEEPVPALEPGRAFLRLLQAAALVATLLALLGFLLDTV